MAKQYGKNSAVDFAPENLMSFGKSFSTLNGQPIVKSEVWYDYDALVAFAATDAAYVGQEVAYVDVDNNNVVRYVIQIDGTLKESGAIAVGDESTIVVAEDGTISLYGIDNLTLERTDENGKTTKINYQPLLVDGKLTWVEPSATTVEGLATEIEGIKTRLSTLEGEGEGSVKAIAEAAADSRVNKFVEDLSDDGVVNTFKELIDYVADHGTEAADMAADILILQGLVGETAVAEQVVTAIEEALKTDGADKYALVTDLEDTATRIQTLEDAGAEKNVIAAVDETQFAVSEDRTLTLLDIAMSKVTGLSDALSSKVTAVEGMGLSENNLTDTLLDKIEGIADGAEVNVLEKVSIGGTLLDIVEKSVNIPVADTEVLGVVKSTDSENGIAVAEDGTMSVNTLNINKLIQTEGDILILDGGKASE